MMKQITPAPRGAFAFLALAWVAFGPLAGAAEPEKKPPPKPSAATLLQMDDGRSGRGNLIATTGIRGFAKPASATAHALIMTIGDYQGNIPKLTGVASDAATAAEIARRLGVPAENIETLRDGELTLDGMRRAFDALEAKLGGNDQVFIYYSGHGTRQSVREADGSERCAESLLTVDGFGFTDAELESRMKRISKNAQKTIAFLDACHSGGATTRSINTPSPAYTPKSYTLPGQSCSKPVNMLTRSIRMVKEPGSGNANFVHIAAARDNEISLDQPGKGGVATQAWLACLSGSAADADSSGGLSAEEIRDCAQGRIDQQLKNVQGFLPHHVALTGNAAMVLSYAAKEPVTPAETAATPIAPAPSKPSGRPSPLSTLNDIYHSRDDRRLVTVTAPRTQLKIGKDMLDFTVTSREGGHVYVLMVGSDGKTFDLLFPNQLDRKNVLEPGSSMRLPGAAWQIGAEGPPGKNTLLIMVTDTPREFSAAGLKPSGPFSAVEASAARDIQLVTTGSAQAASAECKGQAGTRNLAVVKRCSTSYGAALLTIEEVN